MSFAPRMIVAVTLTTVVTLGFVFGVIWVTVNRSQERHYDLALLEEARIEAADLARRNSDAFPELQRPGPAPNLAGPLPLYGALYQVDGALLASTAPFATRAPPLKQVRHAPGTCFDFHAAGTHLRGVFAEVPGRPDRLLLMAMPRVDLDDDARFLWHAMELVFVVAVAWTVLVTTWIVRLLTRAQRRMAQVIHQVASGDLSVRVGSGVTRGDEVKVANHLDGMIDRLSALLNAQRVFIANAAHELRSPLTALYGELSLALRRSRDAEQYRQTITEALESTRQLKVLAEDLLAVARLGAAQPVDRQPVDVREALTEAIRIVEAEGLTPRVATEISGADAFVLARAPDVVRLFRNLIENAFRHSPADGKVRLTIEPGGEQVVVTVADDGPGIAEADRDRIFTPFFQSSAAVPSITGGEVGLGLTIARGLARAHGGDVQLEARSGQGACFRVTLPVAPASAEAGSNGGDAPAART